MADHGGVDDMGFAIMGGGHRAGVSCRGVIGLTSAPIAQPLRRHDGGVTV